MTPVAGCAAHAPTIATAKHAEPHHETHRASLRRRPVPMSKTSGRVFSCVSTAHAVIGTNVSARRRSSGTRADVAFGPKAPRVVRSAVGSLARHSATPGRRTPLVVVAAASAPDRFDELNDAFSEGAGVEASASFPQGSRVALAVAMMLAVTVALAAAHFGATPLADLPRPETWALMHPTSFGLRGCALDPGGILRFLDYAGTALFAQAGVVQAGKRGMDFLGCLIVGCITAMGGGTFRGFVLGERPVFWAAEPDYLYISLAASAATFFFWPSVRGVVDHARRGVKAETLERGDNGTTKTTRGAIGGVFELLRRDQHRGFLRDRREQRFARRERQPARRDRGWYVHRELRRYHPRHVLRYAGEDLASHSDAYASLTMMGACTYVALSALQVSVATRIFVPIVLVVFMRKAAWTFGWRLPGYGR
jgi:uncharacterized membrane protein YeiH